MKKILLLGGSAQQIIAIETAKKLGYYTVLCDFLPDNPGQYVADKFYLISTTDKQAVLSIAKSEEVEGILAYASDPAAPTAAYVAEQLGLPGNPYNSVQILCNKDKFREFLQKSGYSYPKSYSCKSLSEARECCLNFDFPIIIKPVDSSGSKGVTVVKTFSEIDNAIELAFEFSKKRRIILEEYVEKNHAYLIGGDIFVNDGEVILWGLMNCHRDNLVNNLVPAGKSFPPCLDKDMYCKIQQTIQSMVDKIDFSKGFMNIEVICNKQKEVFLLDVGPRSGGNMIPDLLGYIYGINIPEISVKIAMGEEIICQPLINSFDKYYASHNIHVNKDGIFRSVKFSSFLETHIIKKSIYKKSGEYVEYFNDASKVIGVVFLQFDDYDEMLDVLNNIHQYISIELE